jgi:hypothetical protein
MSVCASATVITANAAASAQISRGIHLRSNTMPQPPATIGKTLTRRNSTTQRSGPLL